MLSFAVYSQVSLRTGSRVPAPSTYGPLVRSSCTLSRLRPVTPLESALKAHSRFSPNSAEITRLESIRDFAKSFKAHSYEKYARKSFRAHSCEIVGLKAPSNHTLTKRGKGASALLCGTGTPACALTTANPWNKTCDGGPPSLAQSAPRQYATARPEALLPPYPPLTLE
jgi:hypothetical protein